MSGDRIAAIGLPGTRRPFLSILDDGMPVGLMTDEWNEKAREVGIAENRRADLVDMRNALVAKRGCTAMEIGGSLQKQTYKRYDVRPFIRGA